MRSVHRGFSSTRRFGFLVLAAAIVLVPCRSSSRAYGAEAEAGGGRVLYNGIRWEKPALDAVRPGTNIVQQGWRDSCTVWLDAEEKDPARRYKMFLVGKGWNLNVSFSADGVHWGEPVARTVSVGDRSTVFYN